MKVTTKRRFDQGKDAKWRRVMEEFAGSGLSVREFCRRNAIREPSFYSWRRTLQERDRESKLPGLGANGQFSLNADARSARKPEQAFAPVAVIDQQAEWGGWLPAMEIDLDRDTQVRVDGRCPRALLESLLSMWLPAIRNGQEPPC